MIRIVITATVVFVLGGLAFVMFNDLSGSKPCCGPMNYVAAAPRVGEESSRKPGCRCSCDCCGACKAKDGAVACACEKANKEPCDCCNSCPGRKVKPKPEGKGEAKEATRTTPATSKDPPLAVPD